MAYCSYAIGVKEEEKKMLLTKFYCSLEVQANKEGGAGLTYPGGSKVPLIALAPAPVQ